ncbi:MAG: hybrid sensor histidine kinase/response regulator, partial [Acidobacteria bacterium]
MSRMKRALVVDNNEFYRRVLTDLLVEEGYDVVQAADGLAALEEAKSRRPDLVLLDLVMPKVDGTQVCRFFKSDARFRDIPVVVLSGILVEDMDSVSNIGADAYVAKMPLDRLLPKLTNVIRRLEEGCGEIPVEGFEDLFRREVVAELLEEKRFREQIIASLEEGAAELDSSQRILSVNPAFARLADVDELTVLGQGFTDVVGLSPEEWEGILAGKDAPRRRRDIFPLGDRRVHIKVSRVQRNTEAIGYLVLLEDITDLVKVQEEKEALQRELSRTEKLSALGRMVAGIAHELNNPLTGVLGFTQILMRTNPQDEATRRNLEKVFREATRCKSILENLQSFSNRSMPERKREDLCDILDGVLAQLSDEFERMDVEVLCETDPDIPAIPVDRLDFKKVVEQLISNACRSMEAQSGPRRLRVRLTCLEDRVHLEVQDTGIGIPPEDLERIFDPFYSTADVGQGMGLGLSMVYGIVRDHQGRILVSSRPDEGSTFTVDLPMRQEQD